MVTFYVVFVKDKPEEGHEKRTP